MACVKRPARSALLDPRNPGSTLTGGKIRRRRGSAGSGLSIVIRLARQGHTTTAPTWLRWAPGADCVLLEFFNAAPRSQTQIFPRRAAAAKRSQYVKATALPGYPWVA